jgi:hypothetical protein
MVGKRFEEPGYRLAQTRALLVLPFSSAGTCAFSLPFHDHLAYGRRGGAPEKSPDGGYASMGGIIFYESGGIKPTTSTTRNEPPSRCSLLLVGGVTTTPARPHAPERNIELRFVGKIMHCYHYLLARTIGCDTDLLYSLRDGPLGYEVV